MPFGRNNILANQARSTRVSADGSPQYKPGGITLSTGTLTAASGSDTTLPDDSIIRANHQYLRYGQILCRITTAEVNTVDLSGGDDPTAGTWPLTITANGYTATATGLAWNISAADLQTAVRALAIPGIEDATVTKSGFVYTFNWPANLHNVTISAVDISALTGATVVTIGTTTAGIAGGGMYGPYDPDATDGRQTLTRGSCFILDQTWLYTPLGTMLPANNEIMGNVFDTGLVFIDRVLHSGTVTGTKALGPTLANVLTAFPGIRILSDAMNPV